MKSDFIILKNNNIVINNKEYGFNDLSEIIYRLSKKIKILICDQKIIINKISINLKFINLMEEIELIIKDNFPKNGETLYDYYYDFKKHELYIYYVKCNKSVIELLRDTTSLSIKPVQIVMKEIFLRKFKKQISSRCVITYLYDNYYIGIIEDNILVDNKCFYEKDEVISYLKDCDKTIVNFNFKESHNVIDEEIFKDYEYRYDIDCSIEKEIYG